MQNEKDSLHYIGIYSFSMHKIFNIYQQNIRIYHTLIKCSRVAPNFHIKIL